MANDEKTGIANPTGTANSEKPAPSKGGVLRRGVRSFRPKKQPTEKAAPATAPTPAAPLPESVVELSQVEIKSLPNKNTNTAAADLSLIHISMPASQFYGR